MKRNEKIVFNKFVIMFLFLFFIVVIIRLGFLSLATKIDNTNLEAFASSRNTAKQTIYSKRGNIYDSSKNLLAQTVNSYTVVARLKAVHKSEEKEGYLVIDKEKTAKELSKIINMSEIQIMNLLNKNVSQVELGPGGRALSEVKKEEIEKLKLPGIFFTTSQKRYYPNNEFLSYVIGYVSEKESNMIGEMGVEKFYNEELSGKNGLHEYQKDLKGYKMPNTPEIIIPSKDGVDIHLTIDSNIQYFVETITKDSYNNNKPEWIITAVMDAKTGAILGTTSYPSFDPNKKDIKNYMNPLVSYAFEPGSTMKVFTYMSVLEKGNYDGNETFKSGKIGFKNTTDTVSDWNLKGWGTINYDMGFAVSSNVGIVELTNKKITGTELRDSFIKFGFSKKTGITLPNELNGKLNFRYPIEIANAGFGQGITTTPIQMLQGLTTISNSGVMLKPYIVDRIINSENKIVYEGKREELGRVASLNTVNKIKDLMYNVINDTPDRATGTRYKIEGYDIIGKTGTAQYTDPKTGKYVVGERNYIRSFVGMFPKDDPEIIIYVAMKDPITLGTGLPDTTTKLIKDIANYKGMYKDLRVDSTLFNYNMPNLLNKKVLDIKDLINNQYKKVFIIGDGDKIINQYPNSNIDVNASNTIFLITNYKDITLQDLTNLSLKDIKTLSNMLKLELEYEGTGYVYYQELKDNKLTVKLR